MQTTTIYYLEMTSADALKSKDESQGLKVVECEIKQFQFNRFLYEFVGRNWQWIDKVSWPDEQWKHYAESDYLRTWVAYLKGSPAGYFELQKQPHHNVEIAYFGLAPQFIGQGMGGYLLSQAVQQAWQWHPTRRVWVHTCTLDHPNALNNYQSRGFSLFQTQTVPCPSKSINKQIKS